MSVEMLPHLVERQQNEGWGKDLILLSVSSWEYLPGVYALFNSALLNGFRGEFRVGLDESIGFDRLPKHSQFHPFHYKRYAGRYAPYIQKLMAYQTLGHGTYVYIDADVIIERPCGHLFAPVLEALVVSTEPERKADPYDVLV